MYLLKSDHSVLGKSCPFPARMLICFLALVGWAVVNSLCLGKDFSTPFSKVKLQNHKEREREREREQILVKEWKHKSISKSVSFKETCKYDTGLEATCAEFRGNSKLSGSYRLCDWQLRQRKLQHMGNGLSLCQAIALMSSMLAKSCSSVCTYWMICIYSNTIMQCLIIKRKHQRHWVLQQLDSVLYLESSLMGQHQVNLI